MNTTHSIRILHIDTNHPLLWNQLEQAGFQNEEDYTSTKEEIEAKIQNYHGIVIRSRIKIDIPFLKKATHLQFIARVGAGLESIDCEYAEKLGIHLIAAPEGNRNAVGEHTIGMLLSLLNKFNRADKLIREGKWIREGNRGYELENKTIGIIGYGNMGKSFAKKLRGFDVTVLCHDIQDNVGDENAKQVSLKELQEKTDVLSLHIPWTTATDKMIQTSFIHSFSKPFWFLNTSRGKNVVTADLVDALKSGKILGAGLDVLEYEKLSFENLFDSLQDNLNTNESDTIIPVAFDYLIKADNVLLTPHIAGWTYESHEKLAQIIVNKIIQLYTVD
jgi:D-3-phosphoglycerate dehydrogenase